MKKSLSLLILLLSFTLGCSQNNETEIKEVKKGFEQIIGYSQALNVAKIKDMIYPPIVNNPTEDDDYMKVLKKVPEIFEEMGIKYTIEEKPLHLRISSIAELKNGKICMGEYHENAILEFKDKCFMDSFMQIRKEQGKHVEKLEGNKFRSSEKKYVVGIKDQYTQNSWKYFNYDLIASQSASTILQNEIITKANKLKQSFDQK